MESQSNLSRIIDPYSIITAIPGGMTFPENLEYGRIKYQQGVEIFRKIILTSSSSAEVLETIRNPLNRDVHPYRMTLLKLFRRCVSMVCDTEATKKIIKIPTSKFVDNYGNTFKPIDILQSQFNNLSSLEINTLCALLAEYDSRGTQGYILTSMFFDWFEANFTDFIISGPRGAGRDIELRDLFSDFTEDFPCDFVIKKNDTDLIVAVGFARYDSTRGGSQSDDRTGGNSDKVYKAAKYAEESGRFFKIIFLADGPGLIHGDTWKEACNLDGKWNGRVKVVTLKTAPQSITGDWLLFNPI